jgi:hypothetical protein
LQEVRQKLKPAIGGLQINENAADGVWDSNRRVISILTGLGTSMRRRLHSLAAPLAGRVKLLRYR